MTQKTKCRLEVVFLDEFRPSYVAEHTCLGDESNEYETGNAIGTTLRMLESNSLDTEITLLYALQELWNAGVDSYFFINHPEISKKMERLSDLAHEITEAFESREKRN